MPSTGSTRSTKSICSRGSVDPWHVEPWLARFVRDRVQGEGRIAHCGAGVVLVLPGLGAAVSSPAGRQQGIRVDDREVEAADDTDLPLGLRADLGSLPSLVVAVVRCALLAVVGADDEREGASVVRGRLVEGVDGFLQGSVALEERRELARPAPHPQRGVDPCLHPLDQLVLDRLQVLGRLLRERVRAIRFCLVTHSSPR